MKLYTRQPLLCQPGQSPTSANACPLQQVYCGSVVRLLVLSEKLAGIFAMDEPYAVISITSPGKPEAVLADHPNRSDILRLQFDDINTARPGKTVFAQKHAAQIASFLEAQLIKGTRAFLIHCKGGIYRSAAVAAAISTAVNGEEDFFTQYHQRNQTVYRVLADELSMHKSLGRWPTSYVPIAGDAEVREDIMPIMYFRKPYTFLCNYSPAQVEIDGVTHPTVEHAYQWYKTLDPEWRDKIRAKAYAGHVKQTSMGKSFPIRPGWSDMKVGVMLGLLRQKFADPALAQKLLSTGTRPLAEGNTWDDRFWGVCLDDNGTWSGENMLGKLLMQVRDELRTS